MRTSRDPTYVDRKRHNTYILLMPSVTCGPPLRSLSRSHATYIIHKVIVLIIHERFLTYTCLLIYLRSGVDPIAVNYLHNHSCHIIHKLIHVHVYS
jgi:hypothetical protein